MALNVPATRTLTTASTSLFLGAGPFAVSFFVFIDPSQGSIQTLSVHLVFVSGIQLDLLLGGGGPGRFTASGKSHLGATATSFSPGGTIPTGVATHVAFNFADGAQEVWINGVRTGTSAAAGSIGQAGPSASALQVGDGSSGSGLNAAIDDVAVWAGYTLTSTDVAGLWRRTLDPSGVGGGPAAWLRPDGPDGSAATPADLAWTGTAGLATASVSAPAPTYRAGRLVYVPPCRVRAGWPMIGYSGRTIAFLAEDGSGAASNLTALASHPTVRVNGGAPVQLANPCWSPTNHAVPFVLYPLPTAVGANDTVTATAATQWATAAGGEVAAFTDLAATNGVGVGVLPAFVADQKTMGVGWNINQPGYTQPGIVYNDLSNVASTVNQAADALGFPSAFPATSQIADHYSNSFNGVQFPAKCYPAMPTDGVWTLRWPGLHSADVRLGSSEVTTLLTDHTDPANLAHERTYRITQFDPNTLAPQVTLTVFGAGLAGRPTIYPPGVPTDGTAGKFHPNYLRNIGAGAGCLRFMDAVGTNSSNAVESADRNQVAGKFCPSLPNRTIGGTVVSVSGYANADGYFAGCPMLLTFAAPHGATTGQTLRADNAAATQGPTGDGHYPTTNGTVFLGPQYRAIVRVTSPTTLVITNNPDSGGNGQTVTGSWPVSFTFSSDVGSQTPVDDCVDLTNAVPACDLWWNFPHAGSDAFAAAEADRLAATLAAGRKVYLEYSNEHWNSAVGFFQNGYFASEGRVLSPQLDSTQYYAKRAAEVHAIFRARFVAAGRPATDVVRVMASQAGNQTVSSEILDYCSAHGIAFDALAIAPYLNAATTDEPTIYGNYDLLDVEQTHDLSELYLVYGNLRAVVAGHRALLDTAHGGAFASVRLVDYEGGTENGSPGSNLTSDQKVLRSSSWAHHPRCYRLGRAYFQFLQDSGVTLHAYYKLADLIGAIGNVYAANWPAFLGWDMLAGVGDGSDGLNDNRTDLQALDRIVSVMGGAARDWNALLAPPPPPVTPPPAVVVPYWFTADIEAVLEV